MAITGIDTIVLQVSDLQRSLAFYRDALGLDFTQRSERAAETTLGGVQLLLHVDFDPSIQAKPRGAGIGLHFAVPDADACYNDLLTRGVQITEPPANEPWGREFAVLDPDGYGLEIIGPATPT
jgi:catechol 2,3-dioxygenase-like lactoylglutathione lyase family enzyme